MNALSDQAKHMSSTSTRSPRPRISRLANQLFDGPAPTIPSLRDSAIVGTLRYIDASVDNVIALRVEDYYSVDKRRWLRIVQDGIERNQLVNVELEELIDKYMLEADIQNEPRSPLFRTTLSGSGKISNRRIQRRYVARLARQVTNLQSVRLTPDIAEQLLKTIKNTTRQDVRDRAIIAMMLYLSATPTEIVALRRSDYLENGEWGCIKLTRSRIAEVPKPLGELLHHYLRVEDPPAEKDAKFFRDERSRGITVAHIERMIRCRLKRHADRAHLATQGAKGPRSATQARPTMAE